MRTHLLRTFYPSPAAEPDTGTAANDAEYDRSGAPAKPAAPTPFRMLSSEDDYALGGYAGI